MNPSGLRTSYVAPHPCDLVLRWSLDYPFRREYGSDAHFAEHVGDFLDCLPLGLPNAETAMKFAIYSLVPQYITRLIVIVGTPQCQCYYTRLNGISLTNQHFD